MLVPSQPAIHDCAKMPHLLGLPGRLAPNPANHRRLDPAPSTLAGSRLGHKFPSNPLDVLLNSPKYCLLAGAASQWKCLPRRCSLSASHDRSSVNPWRKSKDVSVPIPVLRLSGAGSLLCSARRGRGGLEDGWDGGPDIRTYVGHALYARNEHAWDGFGRMFGLRVLRPGANTLRQAGEHGLHCLVM